eukprot:6352991-Karenia_brevis.AAC.1
MKREVFGEELHDSKKKEEVDKEESPESKRRRAQEEEDCNDDLWKSTDMVSRDIDVIGREIIEARVDKWIQEIERVVED